MFYNLQGAARSKMVEEKLEEELARERHLRLRAGKGEMHTVLRCS